MAINKVRFSFAFGSGVHGALRNGREVPCGARGFAMADGFCLPELRWLAPLHVRAQGAAISPHPERLIRVAELHG